MTDFFSLVALALLLYQLKCAVTRELRTVSLHSLVDSTSYLIPHGHNPIKPRPIFFKLNIYALECYICNLEAVQTSQYATISRYLTKNGQNWTIQVVQFPPDTLSRIDCLHRSHCISKSFKGHRIHERRLTQTSTAVKGYICVARQCIDQVS